MVQRKVMNKNGVPDDDQVKSDKLSSLQSQLEIKNRGTDLKKMMKKSGSMKRPEIDCRRKKLIRNDTLAAESQACSMIALPNYMKSTSSSVARKEKLQVSKERSENSSCFSKPGLAGGIKATKTVNGLKMTKVLKRKPSFKPGKLMRKKCAEVVLSENLDVQRATCSSTLKVFSHPAYLVLNHGGTESEGTSVMKVCPYTYCSLNGHYHNPSPPLKSFLASRRRILETQRKKTPLADGSKRIDLFIEIYAQGEGNSTDDDEEEEEEEEGNSTDADSDSCPVVISEEDEDDSEASEMNSEKIEYEYLSCEEKRIQFKDEDEVSHETSSSDFSSRNDDLECSVSVDYINGVNNMNISSPFEVSEEQAEPIYEDNPATNPQISDSGMAYYVADLKKDPVEEMMNPSSDGDHMTQTPENLKSFVVVDFVEDSKLEFVEMSPLESEFIIDIACDDAIKTGSKSKGAFKKVNLDEDLITNDVFKLEIVHCKKPGFENEEDREFNPKDPNFLPIQPVPEAEKVDLRHQEMDEKRNAEEWMVDYALRQTVNKLGIARKKKVELLVEAFEKVMPIENFEIQLRHGSSLTMPLTCN